eukprot:6544133-Prymnesium_polylepis.2
MGTSRCTAPSPASGRGPMIGTVRRRDRWPSSRSASMACRSCSSSNSTNSSNSIQSGMLARTWVRRTEPTAGVRAEALFAAVCDGVRANVRDWTRRVERLRERTWRLCSLRCVTVCARTCAIGPAVSSACGSERRVERLRERT